jgi:hypothetical protein
MSIDLTMEFNRLAACAAIVFLTAVVLGLF